MGTEADAIAAVDQPATVRSLIEDLGTLGLTNGDVVIVHSSLSKLGFVAGGAQSVVEALIAAIRPTGTLVMPTQSGALSDPANWSNPPVPPEWIEVIRAELPAFHPYRSGTRGMGQVVECFRQDRDTIRSNHPITSFAARGPQAEEIVGHHPLTPALGDSSPLGRLYDLGAKVLLLGVDHGNDTSLHLAEARATWPSKATEESGVPVLVEGERQWVTYEDHDYDETDFSQLGEAWAATGAERRGPVGIGEARLSSQPALVDFGVAWIEEHRG